MQSVAADSSAHEAMHGHPEDQLNSKLWDYHSPVWDVLRPQVQQLKLSLSTVQVEERYKQLWDQSADRLCNITTPKTYVGLYGATGTGKSTLINALLGCQGDILPVKGNRAGTATVTEISYHGKATYEADVSIVDVARWIEELSKVRSDITNPTDGTMDVPMDSKGDVAVALSKFKSVYPEMSLEEFFKMTDEEVIASDSTVQSLLGTTQYLSAVDPQSLAAQIKPYIDSQEINTRKPAKRQKLSHNPSSSTSSNGARAFWPLVSGVQMRCNSEALQSGVVLVDLPGFWDSNAARENVAREYSKADVLWIVAPMQRAVDDKLAMDFLGDSFKTQMKNGKYEPGKLAIIATKCDDISNYNMRSTHDCDDDDEFDEIDQRLEECRETLADLEEKRLTASRAEKGEIMERIEEARNEQQRALRDERALCSKKRSQSARADLQAQFREGIMKSRASMKDQDEEDDEDIQELDVFTCSSTDYLLLRQGDPTHPPNCFTNPADTGIPSLLASCHNLTLASRKVQAETYIYDVTTWIQEIEDHFRHALAGGNADKGLVEMKERWDSGPELDPQSQNKADLDVSEVNGGIARLLRQNFAKITLWVDLSVRERFESCLGSDCELGAKMAIKQAPEELEKFLALPWQTLRAAFRRHGVINSTNFNTALMEPFKQQISTPWGKTFQHNKKLPIFDVFRTSVAEHIDIVLNAVEQSSPAGSNTRRLLKEKKDVCRDLVHTALVTAETEARMTVYNGQRDISHTLIGRSVKRGLEEGYNGAAAINGKGSVTSRREFFKKYFDGHYEQIIKQTAAEVLFKAMSLVKQMVVILERKLAELAWTIELRYASLWATVPDTHAQLRARSAVKKLCEELRTKIDAYVDNGISAAGVKPERIANVVG